MVVVRLPTGVVSLRSSCEADRDVLCALKRSIRSLAQDIDYGAIPFGIPPIDQALGSGLARGALHEVAAASESALAAATQFALGLASHVQDPRAMVWIAEERGLIENGAPYGPGLDDLGLAPERLVTVAAARPRDVLWAMEEALRCRAVGMVIGEMRPRGIDQVATRRLALAAAAGSARGLILYTAPDDAPSAAVTRWIIGAASSLDAERGHGIGPPRLTARLVRNRRGPLGTWIVEWNSVEQRFELTTHSEPVAGAAFDRPHRTAVA